MNRQVALSKAVAHALRHQPWLYELELDEAGWTPIDHLVDALRGHSPRWSTLTRAELVRMVETQAKARYEIEGEHIRACYGHSLPGRIVARAATPPARLFHGTAPQTARTILDQGLWPMARQYVHLSADRDTAASVGRRKASRPVILVVDSDGAHAAGVRFWHGNEQVWLAEHVPPRFLREADFG